MRVVKQSCLGVLFIPFFSFPTINLFGPVIATLLSKTFGPTIAISIFIIFEIEVVFQRDVLGHDWAGDITIM